MGNEPPFVLAGDAAAPSAGRRLAIASRLEDMLSWIVVPAVLGLICIGMASVVLRYLWGGEYALFWAEEVIRYGFTWVFWLVASIAVAQGSTFAVEMLVDCLPARAKLFVTLAGHVAVMGLLGLYVYQGILMMRVNQTQLSTALEIPMSFAYAAMPWSR